MFIVQPEGKQMSMVIPPNNPKKLTAQHLTHPIRIFRTIHGPTRIIPQTRGKNNPIQIEQSMQPEMEINQNEIK